MINIYLVWEIVCVSLQSITMPKKQTTPHFSEQKCEQKPFVIIIDKQAITREWYLTNGQKFLSIF